MKIHQKKQNYETLWQSAFIMRVILYNIFKYIGLLYLYYTGIDTVKIK